MTIPMVFSSRLKRAETTSSIGAGVLGAGIASLLPERLAPYAIPILLVGLVMHVWGMYDKHRLERRAGAKPPWWAELLYWGCWLGLLVLLGYVIFPGR